MTATHYTAWLTTTTSALDQDNVDITVLEDEPSGEKEDGSTVWTSNGGEPKFYAITDVPADSDRDAGPAAEALLAAAGWTTVGQWEGVETGSIITVERI